MELRRELRRRTSLNLKNTKTKKNSATVATAAECELRDYNRTDFN
jgi:hypothetical protein